MSTPLDRLTAEPARAAILLDVDGTLAPIARRPELARVPAEAREALRALVPRYGLVAVVSGRPGEDAARLVGVDGVVAVGEHGLELEPEAEAWAARLATFVESVPLEAERKRLTAAFHYRAHPDPQAARDQLEQVARDARAAGLRARFGRMVLELTPPLEAHKGTAVRLLLERHGLSRALYAGDDTTDLDAFRAVAELELGVRVAVLSDETPPALVEAADLTVDGTPGLLDLLRSL